MREIKKKNMYDVDANNNNKAFRRYYEDGIFPAETLFKWLNEHVRRRRRSSSTVEDDVAACREFSVGKQSNRYCGFESASKFGKYVRNDGINLLCRYGRIDVGAVYTRPVTKRWREQYTPREFYAQCKEFVLDIDINDYDELRTCECRRKKTLCTRCWIFIEAAIKITDLLLEYVYSVDMAKRMWVFSGRRGVHCWCWQSEFMRMSECTRRSIIDFMSDPMRVFQCLSRTSAAPHHLREVLVREMRVFDSFNVPSPPPSPPPSQQRRRTTKTMSIFCNGTNNRITEIQRAVHFLWPRFDRSVSVKLNHMIKLPFSVHPATGLVCVPLNIQKDVYLCCEEQPFDIYEHVPSSNTCTREEINRYLEYLCI